MPTFEKGKWIWLAEGEGKDQYAEFCDSFTYDGTQAFMSISCDTDYTLFINGNFVASNQYGDFEHYKIYDRLDLSKHLCQGENKIYILVYHCGVNNSRYRKARAGLIYEICSESGILSFSSEKTLSRKSPTYVSGKCIAVSVQLGFTFEYDATKETEGGYSESVCVEKECTFFPRPINKAILLDRKHPKSVVRHSDTHYLIDLGGEVVGLPTLELFSATEQKITVAWGEHIEDGGVRKIIGNRNFYYEYTACVGQNCFTNYMLRLGGRYLEVFSEAPIDLNYAGIIPQIIETEELPKEIEGELEKKIYSICTETLKLCMMEHYVDCPWREQALYAFDSRNQMLCGYYAFKYGNSAYARANLKLIAEDRRDDGLLSICYPCGIALAIPSFSLHYIVAMKEYIEHTSDTTLAEAYAQKLEGILEEFIKNSKDGLVNTFTGTQMWNFYDWSQYSQGKLGKEEAGHTDLLINCLFAIALDAYEYICKAVGRKFPYSGLADRQREQIRKAFLTDKGLFTVNAGTEQYTALGNALAILSGASTGDEAEKICEKLVSGELVSPSLSMKIFVYEALMSVDIDKYKDFILSDIRSSYQKMLDSGHNTVWETEKGASDFGGAGSMCHGWSAVPVYIYHRLGIAK